jgi:hypothetical protein
MKSCSGPPRRISDLYPVPFASSLSFRQRAGGMSGWQRDYDAFTPKGSHLVSQIRAMNWHHRNIDSFSDQPAEQFIVGTVDNVDVDVRGNPLRQTPTDLVRPPFLLAARLRQRFAIGAHKLWRDLSDVVGRVNVLGESPNDPIGFRQRRAALEYQVLAEDDP